MQLLAAASATVILATIASVSFSPATPALPAPPGATTAPAPQESPTETCSDRTLKGKWAAQFGGSILSGGNLQVLGVLDSDGAGAFTTTGRANVNGAFVIQTGKGVYTVNSDCTGTCTIHYPTWSLDLYFVITGDGANRQVLFISTSQPVVISGTVRKL